MKNELKLCDFQLARAYQLSIVIDIYNVENVLVRIPKSLFAGYTAHGSARNMHLRNNQAIGSIR